MTDDDTLHAILTGALADLRVLFEAHLAVRGELEPAGIDYSADRRPSADDPLPIRLDALGHPAGSVLDPAWRTAMLTLSRAFAVASEVRAVQALMSGQGDNVAQASVQPDVTSDRENLARLRLAWLVTHRMWDAVGRDLTDADVPHVASWCEEVGDAARSLPRYLRVAPSAQARLCAGRLDLGRDEAGRTVAVGTHCPDRRRVPTSRRWCAACEQWTAGVIERVRVA